MASSPAQPGGWFDHVQPPRISGKTVGLRVPAVLISPFATPGTVNHKNFDAASVLKFIERTWKVAPLARRDRDATDLAAAFSFRRSPTPVSLIGVANDRRVLQPDRLLLYAGYGSALAIAVAIMVGVVASTTVRDRRRLAGVS
jgi:phospholipase C